MKLLLSAVFTFVLVSAVPHCLYSQTTLQQLYTIPAHMKNGPVDMKFTFTYAFKKVSIGNQYSLELRVQTQTEPSMTYGQYRYRHNGKDYRHGTLDEYDHSGWDGFPEVRISAADVMIHVAGPGLDKVIRFETAIGHVTLCSIEKDADLSHYSLQFRDLKDFFSSNDGKVVKRINNYLAAANKPKVTTPTATKSNSTATKNTTTTGTAGSNTKSNASSDDDYWGTSPTSSTTSKTASTGNKTTGSTQKTQAQVNQEKAAALIAQNNAEQQQSAAARQREREVETEKVIARGRTFYTAQALSDAKSQFAGAATLDGNYNSVEELEAAFNEKYNAISSNTEALNSARNQHLQSNYEASFAGADAKGQAIGQTIVAVGTFFNQLQSEKEEKQAKQALKEQKEQELARINANKKAAVVGLRQSLLAQFPEGGLPLSSHKVDAGQLYFFAYAYKPGQVTADNPAIAISNVFTLARYADGGWPFKKVLKDDLSAKMAGKGEVVLVGYYMDRGTAEEMQASFKSMVNKTGYVVQDVFYKGRASSGAATGTGNDYWGTEGGNTSSKPVQRNSEDDYWSAGGSSSKSTQQVSAGGEDDYWGTGNEKSAHKPAQKKSSGNTTAPAANKQETSTTEGDDFWSTTSNVSTRVAEKKVATAKTTSSGNSKAGNLAYGKWLFIQSDKAVQMRMAKVKQEGNVCYLQMQVRLNKEDKIFCREPNCTGYLWFFSYEPEGGGKIESHLVIKNTYERIYTYPVLIPVTLKNDAGFEQYWDETDKEVKLHVKSTGERRRLELGWSCVDNDMSDTPAHRCSMFNLQRAELLQ